MKKSSFRGIGFYVIAIIVLIGVLAALYTSAPTEEMAYSEVIALFEQAKVSRFMIDDVSLYMELADGSKLTYILPSWDLFFMDVGDLIAQQRQAGTLQWYDIKAATALPWWISFIPYLLIVGVMAMFWFFTMHRGDGGAGKAMSFGKSRARMADGKNKKTFNDVEGAKEEKEELAEIVEFLKNPRSFTDMGARIPKGVLLVGPPGTGKTLLAKAVAGEAGVPFFSISGSDFVELYVGVGASRVRDLFDQAKKHAPSIIFIDEIDAVGRQRGAGLGGGHDEREQTLNQMLVEMDGFGLNEGVIVIAATNRADILDPALLRPGRFDRQVYVGVPDIKGREAILRLHARNKRFDEGVRFDAIAKSTAGFTGADLENLLNEAALLTVRRKKPFITDEELQEAFVKVIMGPEKKSRVIPEKDRRLTAYHEAGHAVVGYHLSTQDPVHQISIIPRGGAGGYNLSLPEHDKSYSSKSEMLETIVSFLGGRVAEKLILDDISTGASNDIERSSDIARKMVTRYGMSDRLGPIAYGTSHDEVFLGRDFNQTRNYSESVAAEIDGEVRAIISGAYERCEEILRANLDYLHKVAEFLLKHETMEGDTFRRIMAGDEIGAIEADLDEREREAQAKREAAEAARRAAEEAKAEAERKARENGTVPPWIPPDDPAYEEYKKNAEAKASEGFAQRLGSMLGIDVDDDDDDDKGGSSGSGSSGGGKADGGEAVTKDGKKIIPPEYKEKE